MTPAIALSAVAAVTLATLAVGLLAGAGLALTRSGARLSPALRFGAAAGGAVIAATGLLVADRLPDPVALAGGMAEALAAMAVVLLGALLSTLAVMDRNTAWAPDAMTLPLCLLIAISGNGLTGEPVTVSTVLVGLGIWGTAQLLWLGQVMLGAGAVPPPDLMLLIAPVVAFGATMPLILYFLAVALTMKACMISARLRRVFVGVGVAERASAETGGTGNPQEAVTFLAIGCPILLIVLALSVGAGI